MPKPPASGNPTPFPSNPSHAALARGQARPAPPPTSNPWQTPYRPSGLRNSVIAGGTYQSPVTRSQGPIASGGSGFQVRGASQAGAMNISGASLFGAAPPPPTGPRYGPSGQQYMNPSVALSASMISIVPSTVAGSTYSVHGTRRPRRPRQTRNNVSDLSNYGPNDYRLGEIFWVPYHQPNSDPTVQATDTHLRQTMAGFVYSKKRMVVVLWTYAEDMYCLPIYSFHGNGLLNKPRSIIPEYVCLQNDDDVNFQKQGVNDPVVAVRKPSRQPFDPHSVVHITGGFKLSCAVENNHCGRLTEESYLHLRDLCERAFDDTKNQQY